MVFNLCPPKLWPPVGANLQAKVWNIGGHDQGQLQYSTENPACRCHFEWSHISEYTWCRNTKRAWAHHCTGYRARSIGRFLSVAHFLMLSHHLVRLLCRNWPWLHHGGLRRERSFFFLSPTNLLRLTRKPARACNPIKRTAGAINARKSLQTNRPFEPLGFSDSFKKLAGGLGARCEVLLVNTCSVGISAVSRADYVSGDENCRDTDNALLCQFLSCCALVSV